MAVRKPPNQHQSSRTRLCGSQNDAMDVRLSKTLSYVLRHKAETFKLEMKPSGYVSVAQLLALPLFQSVSEQQVEKVVQNDAKKRFTLTRNESGHGKLIRANQGHSMQLVQDDQLLIPLKMPISSRQCVHGTYLKFWDRIWNFGLSKMTRNHIHFAEKEVMDDQVVSGMRSSCNLYVYIDFCMAVNDGIKFYKSSNNVVLSPGMGDTGVIEKRYFIRAVMKDGTVVYERRSENTGVRRWSEIENSLENGDSMRFK